MFIRRCTRGLLAAGLGAVAILSLGATAEQLKPREFPSEWFWDDDAKVADAHTKLEGKAMPALEVAEWINGEVKEDAMKGKVVVIDFYATWCGPCVRAIPHNNELMKKYGEKGLVLFGVCTSSNGQEKMAALVKDKGIEYPTAKDPDLKSEAAWAVNYYPTYAVIDRKGVVRAIGLQPDHVEEVVMKLLDEKAE